MSSPGPDLDQVAAGLLTEPGPGGDADLRQAFSRICDHHGRWRTNFPAIASLLESEAARAEVLAGNYATQGSALLEAWVAARVEAGGGSLSPQEVVQMRRRADRFLAEWRLATLKEVDLGGWQEPARERFQEVLEHLLQRAGGRLVADLEAAAERRRGWLARLGEVFGSWLEGLARRLRRLFWPGA